MNCFEEMRLRIEASQARINAGRPKRASYPFPDMKVGAHFTADSMKAVPAAHQYAAYHGMGLKFATKKVGPSKWRITRIA